MPSDKPYTRGTRSPEVRAKISKALKGVKRPRLSPEHREKIAEGNRNRKAIKPPQTPEQYAARAAKRRATIAAKKAAGTWVRKKQGPMSDAHKAALSEAHKGRPFTAEHKAAMSAAQKEYWAKRKANGK
jgi:hypothetical protein